MAAELLGLLVRCSPVAVRAVVEVEAAVVKRLDLSGVAGLPGDVQVDHRRAFRTALLSSLANGELLLEHIQYSASNWQGVSNNEPLNVFVAGWCS